MTVVPEPDSAMKYRVLIEKDEDGVFVVEVPSLPGCVTQGETREQALVNVREAIEAYVESLHERGEPILPAIEEEIIEISP
jgi:predicted RNase H-like HicB family nuclease